MSNKQTFSGRCFLNVVAITLIGTFATVFTQTVSQRPWTVQDSITLRSVITNWRFPLNPGGNDAVIVSPDGQHFVTGVRWGNLKTDTNWFEISIYSSSDVKQALADGKQLPKPRHLIRRSSTSPGFFFGNPGIEKVNWLDDHRLVFAGVEEARPAGNSRRLNSAIFMFDIRTGKLLRLTGTGHDVKRYAIQGDQIVYVAGAEGLVKRDEEGWPVGLNKYPIQPARGASPNGGPAPYFDPQTPVYQGGISSARVGGGPRAIIPMRDIYHHAAILITPRISPDGRWAVVGVPLQKGTSLPDGWSQYEGLEQISMLTETQAPRLQRLVLVDLKSGRQIPLSNSPLGIWGLQAFGVPYDVKWSPDGTRVLLVNVMLPESQENPERQQLSYLVDYEIATERWSIVAPMGRRGAGSRGSKVPGNYDPVISAVQWLPDSRGLLVFGNKPAEELTPGLGDRVLYTKKSGKWTAEVAPSSMSMPAKNRRSALANGLQVKLRTGANEPAMLVASDGKNERILIGSDPTFSTIWRSPVVEVQWTERGGHVEKGGLRLPRAGKAGGPYPLIIQFGSYSPDEFLPDGESVSAFAAQAMAANGFAILDINSLPAKGYAAFFKDKSGNPLTLTKDRWLSAQSVKERVDAAVGELAKRGLVDPRRVGLMGFSHTGFMAHYVVTHPGKITPAAAIVNDSFTFSYREPILEEVSDGNGIADQSETSQLINQYFGGSFWDPDARENWLRHSPAFNVHHAETPVLFLNHGGIEGTEELIGAYRINQREAESLLIPYGEHQLALPRQREAAMGAALEWMLYWLQDKKLSPEKKEQYAYWDALRKQRDERWAKKGNPNDEKTAAARASASDRP